jgi:hypothetical protein
MTRARALALAAQAVNAASTEPEANTAARILARLIHENPDLLCPEPNAPIPRAETFDPIVGFAVREAVGFAGILFRDFMARRPNATPPEARQHARARIVALGFCPVCLAREVERPRPTIAVCENRHRFTPPPGATNDAPKPGPRKVQSPRRVRPRGRP